MGYEIDEYGQVVRKDSSTQKNKKYKIDEYGQAVREGHTDSDVSRTNQTSSTTHRGGGSYSYSSSSSRESSTDSISGFAEKVWAVIKLIGWSLIALLWLLALIVGYIDTDDTITKILISPVLFYLIYKSARNALEVWADEF